MTEIGNTSACQCTIKIGSQSIVCDVDLAFQIGCRILVLDGVQSHIWTNESGKLALIQALSEGATGEIAVLRAIVILSDELRARDIAHNKKNEELEKGRKEEIKNWLDDVVEEARREKDKREKHRLERDRNEAIRSTKPHPPYRKSFA